MELQSQIAAGPLLGPSDQPIPQEAAQSTAGIIRTLHEAMAMQEPTPPVPTGTQSQPAAATTASTHGQPAPASAASTHGQPAPAAAASTHAEATALRKA
eukprot:1987428-Amphidinium_carterae.2